MYFGQDEIKGTYIFQAKNYVKLKLIFMQAVYLYGIAPCTGGLAFGYVGLLSPFMRMYFSQADREQFVRIPVQ